VGQQGGLKRGGVMTMTIWVMIMAIWVMTIAI
jgi:hypothetical protein